MDKTRVLLCLCALKATTVYANRKMGWESKEINILLLHVSTEMLRKNKKGLKTNPAIYSTPPNPQNINLKSHQKFALKTLPEF